MIRFAFPRSAAHSTLFVRGLAIAIIAGAFALGLTATAAAASNPSFAANPRYDWVGGWDWPASATVTITVEDPATPKSPDLQTTAQCNANGEFFADQLGFDIEPGHVITVTDGTTAKVHTVTTLAVTGVDPGTDAVSGTAAAGSVVRVSVYTEDGIQRECTATAGGAWSTDFTDPVGLEPWQQGYDIVPGSEGNAYQEDADGDRTTDDWRVPRPVFAANPRYDRLDGWDWPASATVTITVEDPATPKSPDLQTTAQCNANGEFFADQLGFDIEPGHVITVTDGTTAKVHTVTTLAVTGVDPGTDAVSGTAAAGSPVQIEVYTEGGPRREATASAGGSWVADFTDAIGSEPWQQGYDIVPGNEGNAYQEDADGDRTTDDWRVPRPVFAANPRYDRLDGWDWPASATVTITVEDPATPKSPDLQTTAQCNANGEFFADQLGFDIEPGHVITVTDGTTAKVHTVTTLAVTGVDPGTDAVSGTAAAGSPVQIEVYTEGGPRREATASAGGSWVADFTDAIGSEPWQQGYDIVPGNEGNAYQEDADGDRTTDDWRVPRPVFAANPRYDRLDGWDWPASATVTITVEDPATPKSPDLQTTAQCNANGEFFADQLGFDIEPGHVITVTDGTTAKVHTVTTLAVTGVDPGTDAVSGTAAAGSPVQIEVYTEGGPRREATASAGGSWVADFTDAIGSEPWQQGYDIVPGNEGNAYQEDADGDRTSADWRAADFVEAAGGTRYGTAIAASRSSFETGSVSTVVLATGADFPDALAAGPLAGAYEGPVLLTMPTALPVEVAAEITRLGASEVVIVGGTGAVNSTVFNTLVTKLGSGKVTRIAGSNRYDTAALVAQRIKEVHPALDGTIFIATGANYPDALAAGPDAWAQVRPILLVGGATVHAGTLQKIRDLGADRAIVLGGTGAVPDAAAKAVKAQLTGAKTVTRIAGGTRYDTAVLVASWSAAGEGQSWSTVGVATGTSFADALGGGPVVGKVGGVMLLTQTATLPSPASAALTANKLDIRTVHFYGGTGAVSAGVRSAVARALR